MFLLGNIDYLGGIEQNVYFSPEAFSLLEIISGIVLRGILCGGCLKSPPGPIGRPDL